MKKLLTLLLLFARIEYNGEAIRLGSFRTVEEAARIRDIASLKYFGEFANLNLKS
jgi:hypothetical protein